MMWHYRGRGADRFRALRTLSPFAVAALAVLIACSDSSFEVFQPPAGAPNVDLLVSMAVSNAPAVEGEDVTFTVTVRNNGPLDATDVLVGDTLPTGLDYVAHTTTAGSYTTNGLWTVGSLARDALAVLALTARPAPGTAGSTRTNTAAVLSTAFNDSVQANNVASASVTIQSAPPPPPPPPPPSGSLVFASTWSTQTGSTDNAITDGGRWDNAYCGNRASTLTVVTGSSVGWTKTSNVLRLQQLGSSVCGTLEKENAVPLATTHWGRFYFRNDETGTRHNHVATYNPGVGAPIQTALWNRDGSPQGVQIFMRTYFTANGGSSNYPYDLWNIGRRGVAGPARLAHATWYRYEWMMEYVTPTSYRIYPRIYDMSGTLLYDASSFFQNDYNGSGHSLQTWYDAGNAFGFSDVNLARRFGLGNEGPATSASTGGYWYHADVALSTAGWIGQ